ncbi:CobW family GTP-binding protein [Agrobacterium tumefaciens]|uniref:CobW family GTP-binding protein n=1 Tax=Agrobacterium tumefaciens TaxID=358 RepID=UPI001574995B|nr:GTP-binding protein [Agrobacterium tumefaciens]WCK04435.1 GTP-binding protein [Agrobacterium tumefaciens]
MSRDRIPVSIITGFLGAGKSTLLNRLLKDPEMSDAAIIINEFGDVSIDHMLVESAGEGIIELAEGCLCCTVRGELVDTLAELMDGIQTGKLKPVKRVVIETTGLADPAPVMQSVMGNPVIAQNFVLNGMVTVVDAVNGLSTLDNHEEAVKQAAVADRLVVTKRALADASTIAALTARLEALNPRATIEDADKTDWSAAGLLDNGLYDVSSKNADVGRWLGEESGHDHHEHEHDHDHGHDHHHHDVTRHDASIRPFSIIHDQPIDPMAIDMFVDLLRSAHGEKLLRMKAIVKLSDNPGRPLVLHGVQSIFHTPERLPAWPDPADQRTRMVLITRDLPETFVKDLFAAFTGTPGIDRPDRQAMTDNPLAVSGLRF